MKTKTITIQLSEAEIAELRSCMKSRMDGCCPAYFEKWVLAKIVQAWEQTPAGDLVPGIVERVARHFGMPVAALRGNGRIGRNARVAMARQICVRLVYELTGRGDKTLEPWGISKNMFNYGLRQSADREEVDKEFAGQLRALRAACGGMTQQEATEGTEKGTEK